ncbi:general substrate transporter [Coccomyxa subellipsoidea C-169]|uniref:General substrate transporter n=1 Tax=Coccomyxa subellipsoidea (strain C-169) TaxID=574566 RepID=I0YQD4_COCSC|nr:general substrate transporter [Coccomyxa subellipsoidea C-169]EIE20603.1 general substrate transporter [Coccomyxa subellipsoidea C-169]|eukprot:XP_005645147.1 general substrate transporter [Coccomyxa subellipsoidea C-169]
MAGGLAIATVGTRSAEYHGELSWRVFLVCIVASSGGLLFGYDLGIAGGVASMHGFLERFFPEVILQKQEALQSTANKDYCQFDSQTLQLWQSSMFLAGAFAGLLASWISNRFGRRFTMICGGFAFVVGSVMQAAANHIALLVIGRVVLGVAIGFATQAVPMYLSEMSPATLRGSLNICFQLATAFGILIANCINYGTNFLGPNLGWRLSLGLASVPAFVFFVGSLLLPDTPNSLVQRGYEKEGRQILELMRGTKEVEAELADIKDAVMESKKHKGSLRLFTQRRHIPQLLFSILIPVFQQFTGINAFIFYAPQIFITLGMAQTASLLGILIVTAINIGATLVAIYLVDRVGRKKLFWAGGVQMILAQIAATILMAVTFKHVSPPIYSIVLIEVFVCMFTAGFAYSWGPLGWLVPTEIHTIETRSLGQSVTVFTNFLSSFCIAQSYLSMMCRLEYATFIFFAGCVAVMTLTVAFLLPETRGVPIEEVNLIWEEHPVWKRVVAPRDTLKRQTSAYAQDIHKEITP